MWGWKGIRMASMKLQRSCDRIQTHISRIALLVGELRDILMTCSVNVCLREARPMAGVGYLFGGA